MKQMFPKSFFESDHFQKFWTSGTGKSLIDWTGAKPNESDFNQYAHLYYQKDDLADAVIEHIFSEKGFEKGMQEVFDHLRNASEHLAHPSIKALLQQMFEISEAHKESEIAMGSKLVRRAGLNSLMVLRDYSLMGGYDFAYLNKALIYTGALRKGAVKRLEYTLEFWIKVTRSKGLQVGMPGFEQCLRTRLVHAYSRHQILKTGHWNAETWGMPINSWDMMATYFGFSLIFLHGLHLLQVSFDEEEEKSLFALWKEIGALIGIPAEILPLDAKSATDHFFVWSATQPPADSDSVKLAHALLDESLEFEGIKFHFQRRMLRYMHICMNHFFLDTELIERLEIPQVSNRKFFPQMIQSRNRWEQKWLSEFKREQKGHKAQMKILMDYQKLR